MLETAELISQALKRCAEHATNRGAWIGRQADEMNMPEGTFKSYFYGEQSPPLPAFLRMCSHFGPRFATDALEPAGLHAVKSSDYELIQSAELLSAIKQLIPVLEGVVKDARETVKLRAAE